jgi:hypothetical protein
MQYVDWDELQDKEEAEFDKVIKICDRFQLSDIMGFQYHWNKEVLAQFHATYFYDQSTDDIHWMMDGQHYKVDYTIFRRILGFGEEHRPILTFMMSLEQRSMTSNTCGEIVVLLMARGVVCTATTTS